MKKKSLVIVLLVTFALLAVQAHAMVGLRWDSDFNADTVGLAPSTLTGNGFPSCTVLTEPHENTVVFNNPDPNSILVQSSAGGLTDQPAVLEIFVGNDQPENLTYADYDGYIFDSGDTHVRLEWDMSIISSTATSAGCVIVGRLDGLGFGPSMIKWGVDEFGVPDAVGIMYGEGAEESNWQPWSFNTPMHMVVEFDYVNDLYSVYKDGAVIVEDLSVPGLTSVFSLALKSAHGGVGTGVGGIVAIDNFEATVLADDGTEDCGGIGTCAEMWAAGQGMAEDLNEDCVIDLNDLAIISGVWLMCNNPEPPCSYVPVP